MTRQDIANIYDVPLEILDPMRHRVCDYPQCKTVLSRFNAGEQCWTHQSDLTNLTLTQKQIELLARAPRSCPTSSSVTSPVPTSSHRTSEPTTSGVHGDGRPSQGELPAGR